MQTLEARTQYRNSFHCAYRIFTEEGILRFWTGTTPRLARLVVSYCFKRAGYHYWGFITAQRWDRVYSIWEYHQSYWRANIVIQSIPGDYGSVSLLAHFRFICFNSGRFDLGSYEVPASPVHGSPSSLPLDPTLKSWSVNGLNIPVGRRNKGRSSKTSIL